MDIFWNKPTTLNIDHLYNIQIYRSITVENGDYSVIATISALNVGLDVTSYTDGTGLASYFYYVKYVDLYDSSVGDRILARIGMSVREQRIAEEVFQQVPEVIRGRFSNDPKYFVVRRAINDGLNTINYFPPITSYTLDNLPVGHESVVSLVALVYIYMQQYLGVAIRDINFAGGIPSVSIDRGSRIKTATDTLMGYVKEYIVYVKMYDYPQPIGLGSMAIAVPQQRIFSFLYNAGGNA